MTASPDQDFARILELDWTGNRERIAECIAGRVVLVIGGAGTIGSACVHALLGFAPRRIDIIDIDENGLARLTRDIRARFLADLSTELRFFALDFGTWPALACMQNAGPYDVVYNLAAVKHVRSEKNVFTLLHMLETNVVKQQCVFEWLQTEGLARRYFAVSTDKAADPVSFMGATKKLLEDIVVGGEPVSGFRRSMARFANVAYSSGSLLESFVLRLGAGQPLAVPKDTRRYFISKDDAAKICLLTSVLCPDRGVAIPRLRPDFHAEELSETVTRFLKDHGLVPCFVNSVQELVEWKSAPAGRDRQYPVLLTPRDTFGEKEIETFLGAGEEACEFGLAALDAFVPLSADRLVSSEVLAALAAYTRNERPIPSILDLYQLIKKAVSNFEHAETSANLDDRL